MRGVGTRALVFETRRVLETARDELSPSGTGTIGISGMLAEQLAKELGADATPWAVLTHDTSRIPIADVLVRVIAGEPSQEDEALVRAADRHGTPVVLVQLWPQADWKPPFVLSPFVVECQAGRGFPLGEIADRIFDASEHGPLLGASIPVLSEAISRGLVRRAGHPTDGRLVLPWAVDHMTWNADTVPVDSTAVKAATKREVWISGDATARAKQELLAQGFGVAERRPVR